MLTRLLIDIEKLSCDMNCGALNDPYLAKEIIDTMRDPLLVLNQDLEVICASKNFYKNFEVVENETVGEFICDLGNGQWNISALQQALRETITTDRVVDDYEIEHMFEGIGRRVMLLNARKFISPHNGIQKILLVIEDVTEKKELQDELKIMATTDQLTGLFNRYKFYEILEDRIQISKRTGQITALLSIDLDYFKVVNDRYGHCVGDEVLKSVAEILKSTIRSTDTAARIGGDEFAIIIFNPRSIDELKSLLQRIISRISIPMNIQGDIIKIGASIGVSFCPTQTLNLTNLLKFSDDALYAAKGNGRNQYQISEHI
ncbi:diguanylate cyclase [Neptuniibacter sp. PT34_22]|uniref:diguanylate cyclase n=1 Tax=Neptuniibacter sp. PT34_22 TaxID=3398205 RepID=UPI0039F5962F